MIQAIPALAPFVFCTINAPCVIAGVSIQAAIALAYYLHLASAANQRKNRQARAAAETYERECGRKLSEHEKDQIHDLITGQDLDFDGIVRALRSTFGCPGQSESGG